MEVGAIKHAFNNELILLKKQINQAKIQIIHKLTRKAKTFTEKKAPEHIKEKLKRKAEAAVNEVLILKKIKPKDLAKFAVTHKGKLNDHLNKPMVDLDKACARLLLHKSLQDKYNLLRSRYSSIPIEDLLMSRDERKKLKKEEREKQKNKKKRKDSINNVVNAEGEWVVEDINVTEKNKNVNDNKVKPSSDMEEDTSDIDDEDNPRTNEMKSDDDNKSSIGDQNESEAESDVCNDNEDTPLAIMNSDNESDNSQENENNQEKESKKSGAGLLLKLKPEIKGTTSSKNIFMKPDLKTLITLERKIPEKKANNKNNQVKNRNLNEKLLTRKFKKESIYCSIQETTKVVDSFFITSSGENYMSVAEPRQPDEVKEVHKQGNRKLRRAAMFGRVPKIIPRQDNFESEDNRFNKQNRLDSNKFIKKFNGHNEFNNDKRKISDKGKKFDNIDREDSKPEKLHPSWEAKKRQSGILPFQGKKIVFDES